MAILIEQWISKMTTAFPDYGSASIRATTDSVAP